MPRISLLHLLFVIPALHATDTDLDSKFTKTVRPFVTTYCTNCHSGNTPAAQFDLQPYTSTDAVVKDYPRWNLVLEKLSAREMPPKAVKQPADNDRQAVIDWIQQVRSAEARKHAGDPGPVLARRLSNSEYNYTIRDLTGVALNPTREFPVDPANTAGFDNSGESLTMSPALLNKYLQAARDVANHLALTPDGFVFAPYPQLVETDREKFAIQRIVSFYESQPTDYADYFLAAWRHKHNPNTSLDAIAAEAHISPKYLPQVWRILEVEHGVGPIAKLQAMWHALPDTDTPELRTQCIAMRDYVKRIRKVTAMEFASPKVQGLYPTSQPLMNWKLKEFAANRRHSDPNALRLDTDPPPAPEAPGRYPGLGQEAAVRAAILMAKARAAEPELVVPAAQRDVYQDSFERFANVFPDAFFIRERGRFYPDDSQDKGRLLSADYHNVMGYFRDDTPLIELILDYSGKRQLDRLWTEFDFMADYTGRTWVQYYFNQSGEILGNGRESGNARPSDKAVSATPIIFGLRDAYLAKADATGASDVAKQAIREHFALVNQTLRGVEKLRAEAEPHHIDALLKFAARAYRRPLTELEQQKMRAYYRDLREKSGLTHEEAIRDSIVSVLMSPKFSYRVESAPLTSYNLATRLSYFLWSSMPDEELLRHAASGDLKRPEVLAAQARRMLKDARARGLAIEFGGNWLDFRRFEDINSVDRERFPVFTNELREAMFEEPVRYLEDVIRNNRSVLDLVYGNYTFVNRDLAKFYGMPEVNDWTRVDNAGQYGRGGILPMAAFLTQNAPGLRTSPVKRGYWVVRRVLGEVIPPPPPNVPELPHDEAKMDLPLRDMLAQHRSNPACFSCHSRFDSFGLAFEGYGPVGEKRAKDLAGHPVDTVANFPGGAQGSGFEGVRDFIREHRQNDFVDNLSRKLLAYAFNRSLMLSDDLVVEQMRNVLAANNYRFTSLIETIVTSPQFMSKRAPDSLKQRSE